MTPIEQLDLIAISVRSNHLCKKLLNENPVLDEIMHLAKNETEALIGVRNWILREVNGKSHVIDFYKEKAKDHTPASQDRAVTRALKDACILVIRYHLMLLLFLLHFCRKYRSVCDVEQIKTFIKQVQEHFIINMSL